MRAGSREHGSHVAMLIPRTPLGRPSGVQRYSSSMHGAMEEDMMMTNPVGTRGVWNVCLCLSGGGVEVLWVSWVSWARVLKGGVVSVCVVSLDYLCRWQV